MRPLPTNYNKPNGHWLRQWGASAVGDDGTSGLSSNQPTEDGAKQAAIGNCEARGGKQCLVDNTFSNSCLVIANGKDSFGKNYSTVAGEVTLEKSIKMAMELCKSQGTECHVFRTICSPPRWISE